MKIQITAHVVAILLLVTGCNSTPKGMQRKIDGTSDQSAKQSVEMLTTELSPDQLKKFTEAYSQLALRWAFANAFGGEASRNNSELLKIINGKTAQEIIDLAAVESSGKTKKSEDKASKPIHFNLPFNIDGIEILITDLRLGKLEKIEKKYSYGSLPDKDFLLASVSLKNTTEGKIILVMNAWDDTTVTDNFDNIYSKPDSLGSWSADVKGAISMQELMPGDTASDLIIIEKPLEKAQDFTLQSDPNFFRKTGSDGIERLSSDSFHLKFKRADIK